MSAALLLLPVELAVDGNHDGTISLSGSGGSDQTSQDQPYTFWVNDDDDHGDGTPGSPGTEHVPIVRPDYESRKNRGSHLNKQHYS